MKNIITYFRAHKHRLATVALVFGFLVDIITFRNLNLTYALIILGAHLFIVALSILILSIPFEERESFFITKRARKMGDVRRHPFPNKRREQTLFTRIRSWIPVVQQYSMGNLLSAFLVLYSASGSFAASWPFLALVAVAAVGNEAFRLQKYRLPFQMSLFFLNLILFFALLWPVVFRSISTATFLMGLAVAAVVFGLVRRALWLVAKNAFNENKKRINRWAFGMLAAIVALYFTNLIPPIPLTIKEIGFYHSVARVGDAYVATDEKRGFFEEYFSLTGETLFLHRGAPAYVYTSIFAPARLGTDIAHRWEYWDEGRSVWVMKNVVDFPIVGGRSRGYRGYSLTENPEPGRWRVSVETSDGRVLGRSYLLVRRATTPVDVSTIVID